jgi:hypothetical protein
VLLSSRQLCPPLLRSWDNEYADRDSAAPIEYEGMTELEIVLATMKKMPTVFSSLQEANAYFEFISNVFLHCE